MDIKEAYIGHLVMNYSKFHCELVHFDYFWCDKKKLDNTLF